MVLSETPEENTCATASSVYMLQWGGGQHVQARLYQTCHIFLVEICIVLLEILHKAVKSISFSFVNRPIAFKFRMSVTICETTKSTIKTGHVYIHPKNVCRIKNAYNVDGLLYAVNGHSQCIFEHCSLLVPVWTMATYTGPQAFILAHSPKCCGTMENIQYLLKIQVHIL